MRVLSCKAVKVGCQPHGISVQPCRIPALLIREKYHYVGCFSRFCHTLSVWLAAPNVPVSLATINEKLLRGSMLHTAGLINPRLASNKPICSIYNYFKVCVVVPRSALSEKPHTGGAHPITESFYLPPAEHRLARDPYHHLQ